MKPYLLFSTSGPVGTQQSTFYGMYRKQQGHAFDLWGQIAVCICLLSLTLLTALLFTLSLFSTTILLGGPPSPKYMYMFSVRAGSTREKGGKEQESNAVQTRRLAGWNMRYVTTWDTDIGTILNSDYTGENWRAPKMFSKTWGSTKLVNSYLFPKTTLYSM